MIKIQSASQFARALVRMTTEPQEVTPHSPGLFIVWNTVKRHSYTVRIKRTELGTFGNCSCAAGTPANKRSAPQVCKHLAATVYYIRDHRQPQREQIAA